MPTNDDVLKQLTVPPARRQETREVTVSVCQAPGCGKEFPDWPDQQTWLQFVFQTSSGQWALYFCSWAHVAEYATAAAKLVER